MNIKQYIPKALKVLPWVGMVILAVIFFQRCNTERELLNKHDAFKKDLLAKDKALEESNKIREKESAERDKKIASKDSVIAVKEQVIETNKSELKKTTAQLRRILKDASDQPLDLTDSINRLVHIALDSALSQMDQMSLQYAALEYAYTELQSAVTAKDTLQSQQLQSMSIQLRVTRDAYLNLLDKYNILFADLQKVAKKHKRAKALTKILAAVALAEAAGLLLK